MVKFKIALAVIAVLLGVILNIYYRQQVPDGLASGEERALRMLGVLVTVIRKMDYATSVLGVETHRRLKDILTGVLLRLLKPTPPSDIEITNTNLAGVPVRVYKSAKGAVTGDEKLPGLVYYHGGGWTSGTIDAYDELCYALSRKANVIVVSVEYRLAPDHLFPAAYDDCYNVATALLSEGATFGIDPTRIILGGDSAGGNLAAAVAHQLKDRPHRPAGQFSDFHLPSMRKNGDLILDRRQMATFWSLYLNGTADLVEMFAAGFHAEHLDKTKYASYTGSQNMVLTRGPESEEQDSPHCPEKVLNALTDPRAAPLMADDVAGLPRTFLLTAQFDVLCSEGLLYKQRLEEAGVDVTHRMFQSFHGFFSKPDLTDEASRAFGETVEFLKQFSKKHRKP